MLKLQICSLQYSFQCFVGLYMHSSVPEMLGYTHQSDNTLMKNYTCFQLTYTCLLHISGNNHLLGISKGFHVRNLDNPCKPGGLKLLNTFVYPSVLFCLAANSGLHRFHLILLHRWRIKILFSSAYKKVPLKKQKTLHVS